MLKIIRIVSLVVFTIMVCCLVSPAAMYENPTTPTEPTYTLSELNQMVGWLETYYGDCMKIFYLEEGEIDLCKEAYAFTKKMETGSINILISNPTYTSGQWSDAVYAAYLGWFSNSRWSDMFDELTQSQVNTLLYKVMYWNPLPYDDERTFAEFKTWVLQ